MITITITDTRKASWSILGLWIAVNNLDLSYDSGKNKKSFTLDVDLEYLRASWRTCMKITLNENVKAICLMVNLTILTNVRYE